MFTTFNSEYMMRLNSNKLHFFIGSYTEMLTEDFGGSGEGIYSVEMDIDTGEIKVSSSFKITNPAYLVSNKDKLYAVSEVESCKNPKVTAFEIQQNGLLTYVNEQRIEGSLPCHVNFHNKTLFIACYGSGNLLSFPLNAKGEILESNHNFSHTGKSINTLRQEAPHAHQVVVCPNGKHLFVPDLGIDKIKGYTFENEELRPKQELDVAIPNGNGPRHMVFNSKGDLAYVMNELTGKVAVLQIEETRYNCIELYNTLPDIFKETPSGAAIRINPNGKFLYVANRTIDCVTIFKIIENKLQLLTYQYTNGKTIREFNITPNGNWLIACLQDSNEVISYKIEPNGLLEEKSRTNNIVSPVCVCF